jgi:hypothetical protein
MDKALQRVFFILLCIIFTGSISFAEDTRRKLETHGELETSAELEYRRAEDNYVFDFPLYAAIGIFYKTDLLESSFSLLYRNELDIGDTYLMGGSEYSYMKIGFFVEEWGIGYALSPISILNNRDSRFPDTIFYRKRYRPNPVFSAVMGGEKFHGQAVLSNKDENIESIDDTDFGFRGEWSGGDYSISLGFIRKIGKPPPLIFLTADSIGTREKVWLELGWIYNESSANIWNIAVGYTRELGFADIYAEYIIEDDDSVLYLEELFTINDLVSFDLKSFLHIPDLSNAFNGFFILKIEEHVFFEPGFYLYFGEGSRFFSRLEKLLVPANSIR